MQPTQGTLNLDEVIKTMCGDPLAKALWENAQLQVLVRQQANEIAELTQSVTELKPARTPVNGKATMPPVHS